MYTKNSGKIPLLSVIGHSFAFGAQFELKKFFKLI